VEKPMVVHPEHFGELLKRMEDSPVILTLGLNRRYSPLVQTLREEIDGPVDYVEYMITEAFLPADHWTLDPIEGGGRLVSEGEHFIDLCNLLIGKRPISVVGRALGETPADLRTLCNFAVNLQYDGAVANVVFNESGAAQIPRERLVVLARGQVATLDDFGKLTVHGRKVESHGRGLRKSMGHAEELQQFVRAIRGEPNNLLTWEEASLATLCMFAAQESIRTGAAIDLQEFRQGLMADAPRAEQAEEADPESEPAPVDLE
jgi:predicted dehydrogenase